MVATLKPPASHLGDLPLLGCGAKFAFCPRNGLCLLGPGWHAALPVGGAYTLKEKQSVLQLVSPSSVEGVEGTKH